MIASARPQPQFHIGQIVRHRRYRYRGVIVHLDPFCVAPPEWYAANQTQPDREQAWYHVLVDGKPQITYAAQSNLQPDSNTSPVFHPLVEKYFCAFENGVYVRNDRPWEGSW